MRTGRVVALALAGVLFFGSGFAALVYQVAWQRILALQTGVGVSSVCLIVAAFMLGLGLGSYVGGVSSPRVAPARALLVFGLAELVLGLFALASCGLYYDLLYVRAYWLFAGPWGAAITQVVGLLLPTFLMGLSLPFLVRALVREPGGGASRVVGYLYAVNVLGAAAGSLVTAWALFRFHGIRGAVAFGAAANLVAGLGALVFGRVLAPGGEPEPIAGSQHAGPSGPWDSEAGGLGFWMLLYGLSGFCALSLEIVWFRLIDVATKSTALTLGTVLGVYLLGLALGTFAGVQGVPALARPLRTFLASQCLLIAYAAAAVAFVVRVPVVGHVLGSLHAYWGAYDEFVPGRDADTGALLRLYALLPVALHGIPTALMGVSFVALQRAVQDDPRTSGRKVGLLQAANIAGCVIGALAGGLASLRWLGTVGTLRAVVLCGLVFAAVGVRRLGLRSRFGALGALLLALALGLPDAGSLWLRLHGRSGGPAVLHEDATGLVMVAPEPRGRSWQMSVNGRGVSSLPFGGLHSLLGAVPALVHPAPRDIAIVGLGSGDTAWAASCRKETQRTTVFEILGPEPRVLRELASLEAWPDLRAFLADPRVAIRIVDGRRALDRETRVYDLIEGDPLEPFSAYSGNLYSLEFFERCASRLGRGGLMCSYAPSPRTRATFLAAFPHVLEFGRGEFLVGGNEGVEIDVPRWLDRLESASSYLGPEIAADVAASLRTARAVQRGRAVPSDVNRDLFPRDEFLTP